ncbi:MAG: short-chain dehydrogenase [Actinomycetota bacterium]|jgi:NAD(P)-dependent dehydrogenase (short-subunit alcohol dehydrogenase family)|nr:MAG: short-chain dehydrogenase [Actinomycetota bacterium]
MTGGILHGRAALVTGGTTGIGRAIARRFLDEGAAVVITGRDEALGAAARDELAALGPVRFVRADAADPEAVAASVEEAVGFLGGLDVLVNNAGVGVVAGVLDTPLEAFDLVMDVNVRGAFCYAKAAFPHLEARRGCMLHIASDAGVLGEVEIAVYSVSKAALIMLSNMLAIEGGRRGVRSNAICPGDTEPGMRHMLEPGAEERPEDVETWPLPPVGRVGRATDVAEAALFLASDRAAFVNGVALLVDGGMRAGMRAGMPRA